MEPLSSNPWLVTLFGMSVVMITLAILLALTKILSALAQCQTRGTNPQKTAELRPSQPETNAANTQSGAENNPDNNIMAVIAAAVHSVLGPKARVIQASEQQKNAPQQSQTWQNISRWSQMQAQQKSFGRK